MPFTGESLRGVTAERISAHKKFKRVVHSNSLSQTVGPLLNLGKGFSQYGEEDITEVYMPYLLDKMDGVVEDVILAYAIVLWFSVQVRH